ncbi:MAG: winged helix-turn-helix domain-containing protein [Terracidiphilus sp.]
MDSAQRLLKGFELGEWTVKPEDGSLISRERTARLEPLQMALLVFLCSRAGRVVTRNEILEAIWHGRFVSDDTVKSTFYQLRKALGDAPRKPRYIETLPKRGYRTLLDPVPLDPANDASGPHAAAAALYRKGAALLAGQPGIAALMQARLYFERAIEADAAHAESGAALAQTYIHLIASGTERGSDLLPRARAYATRALEADPSLSSAHLALGVSWLLGDWETAEAEKSFRIAMALDPADSAPHSWLARLFSFTGKHIQAIAEARAALKIDPLSLAVRRDLVETLFVARSYSEAIAEGQHLLRISGQTESVWLGLAWIYWIAGDAQRAFEAVDAGFRALGVAAEVQARAQHAFQSGGMREVIALWADLLQEQADLGQPALDLVFLHSLLDERDRAFEMLDLLFKYSHPALLLLPASPLFDNLRSDPRYDQLLARMKANLG